jgi:hypothetical protein
VLRDANARIVIAEPDASPAASGRCGSRRPIDDLTPLDSPIDLAVAGRRSHPRR